MPLLSDSSNVTTSGRRLHRTRLSNARYAVTCVLAVCLSATATADDWNQWRGPSRDSSVTTENWPSSLSGTLKLGWEQALDASYSGPVVQGGVVYTTETVDDEYERVTAFNLEDGEKIWSTRWEGAINVPFFAASNGSWIRSTPAVTPDALVVFGIRDVLVCLDPETGDEKWRVDFAKVLGSNRPAFGAVCSPIIDGDAVYVQTGGPTVKLSLADGSVTWKTLESGPNMMSGGAFSSPIIATINGQRQLVVQTRMELAGVNLETGGVLWKEPIEAFRGMNILTPTVIGNRVYTAAHSGRSQLFEVDKSDTSGWGIREAWNQKIQGYMSSPVVIEDTIYIHAKNQRLSALDLTDGEVLWTSRPMGKYQSMIRRDKQILVLDQNGELLLLNHNREKLDIADRMKVADDSWAHLAIAGRSLIVRDLKALKVYDF
ncbi:MAG: PQQ-binding-like beta-propeller repeat protein [Planctomycetota bacterium]